MRDSLLAGMIAGFVLGMVAVKNVPEVNKMYDKGEKIVNKAMK